MFAFLIPPAIQAATTGVKIAIVCGVLIAVLSAGVYGGMHWEKANTIKVQSDFDKYKSDKQVEAEKQKGDTKAENQRLINEKELSDAQNDHARRSLVFFADRVRSLQEESKRTVTVMPQPPADTGSPQRTCFDSAELIGADTTYRAGEAARIAAIYAIVEEGAKATVDLDSAKLWAQRLPKPSTEVSE